LAVYMNLLVAEISNVNGQFVFDEEDSAESEENNSVNPDACTTPDNLDGICTGLARCIPLINLLKKRPITAPVISHLRKSICRFSGKSPYVCCPELKPYQGGGDTPNTTTTTTTTTQPTTTTELPERISLPNVDVCGQSPKVHAKIVGGKPAELHAWPWIAALGFRARDTNETHYRCGGSLITKRHVLTAAHCATSKSLFTVRLGEHELNNDNDGTTPLDIEIESKVIHENYNPKNLSNDIAVLTLKQDVEIFDEKISPVCLEHPELGSGDDGSPEKMVEVLDRDLPRTRFDFKTTTHENKTAFVAGWGTTKFRGPQSKILKETFLSVTSEQECMDKFGQITTRVTIDKNKVCAVDRAGQSDACQGDSGGPLMVESRDIATFPTPKDRKPRWVLIGVVSFGYRCGIKGFPGVYTRVSEYMDWVQSHLN